MRCNYINCVLRQAIRGRIHQLLVKKHLLVYFQFEKKIKSVSERPRGKKDV